MIQQEELTHLSQWLAVLEFDSGEIVAGQVLSFEGDTIELGFSRADAPLLGIAQLVVLRMRSPSSINELRIPVRVVARADDDAQRRYELQPRSIGDLARLKRQNRGQYVRVQPSPDAPMSVELRDHAGRRLGSGGVIDVSIKGLGLLLEPSDELSMRAYERLSLVIQLSDDPRPRTVSGIIRTRRLIGASIRIGIEFEPERTPEFQEAEQWFTRYVMRRQYEMALDERHVNPAA